MPIEPSHRRAQKGDPLAFDSRSAIFRWPVTFFDRRLAHAILALPAGFSASFVQQT
jgi:hypothetical protein